MYNGFVKLLEANTEELETDYFLFWWINTIYEGISTSKKNKIYESGSSICTSLYHWFFRKWSLWLSSLAQVLLIGRISEQQVWGKESEAGKEGMHIQKDI